MQMKFGTFGSSNEILIENYL